MGFEYTIKAIPTLYSGVMFRSRLEATWAAFFDQVGLVWDYEPFDLEGWCPDFLIKYSGRSCLIEVKPVELEENPKNEFGFWSKFDFPLEKTFSKAINHMCFDWEGEVCERPYNVFLCGLRPVSYTGNEFKAKLCHMGLSVLVHYSDDNEYILQTAGSFFKESDWEIAKNKIQKQYR